MSKGQALLAVAGVVVLAGLQLWAQIARRKRATPVALRSVRPAGERRITRAQVLTYIALGLLAVFFFIVMNVRERGSPSASHTAWTIELMVQETMKSLGIVLAVLLVIWLILAWLSRDSAVKEAARLAAAGKGTDAEALLRGKLAERQTFRRWQVLAILLMDQKRYAEALEAIERAEQLASGRQTADNERAIALFRLGRHEEALALFAELGRRFPRDFLIAANHAMLLSELPGREAEAYAQLERAQRIYDSATPSYVPAAWTRVMEEARARLPAVHGFPVMGVKNQERGPTS